MTRGQDIQERLVQFAAGVIRLVSGLPRTMEGKHIAGQLAALQDECNQLQRILSASIKTARRNMHN